MRLAKGGLDVWYIDESLDQRCFAISAIAVPLLRNVDEAGWSFVWDDHLSAANEFRRKLRRLHGILVRKELHGWKLLSGRGRYRADGRPLTKAAAATVFRWILSELCFLQDASIITISGEAPARLYGHKRLQAALYALFQRMQRASVHQNRNGMVFFDEGHGEYGKLYRQARVYLPTGSTVGSWQEGTSKNVPMSRFVKDANYKRSSQSQFIQLADMVAYAAFLRAKARLGLLEGWQEAEQLGQAYDEIPRRVLNLNASRRDPRGIVWLAG